MRPAAAWAVQIAPMPVSPQQSQPEVAAAGPTHWILCPGPARTVSGKETGSQGGQDMMRVGIGAVLIGRRQGMRALALCLGLAGAPAFALDNFALDVNGGNDALRDAIRAASLTAATKGDDKATAQDVFGAARADYGRILGVLYSEGYYSGVIHILIDGREAADIAPLDAPERIGKVKIAVEPGPLFTFSRAGAAPLAKKTELPSGYAAGQTARSGVIVDAAGAGIDGWRARGHAKARVSDQSIVADHRADTLASDIRFDPGPRVRFGSLTITGANRTIPRRIAKVAGFPTGEIYDPEKVDEVVKRVRRTGTFKSVTMTEADTLGPGNTLDYTLNVSEQKRRRMSFGAEITSQDGVSVSASWLHRNLFNGMESLRFDASVTGIDAVATDVDYDFGVRLDRPGTPFRDNTAFIEARAQRLNEDDYTADVFTTAFGVTRHFSEEFMVEAGLGYGASDVTDDYDHYNYRQFTLPLRTTWDSRDNPLDATKGYFLRAEALPFRGLNDETGTGARLFFDTRGYHGFGAEDRVVIAARVQGGSIVGSDILETPRDYLFYSGGGGTVRGQPYQSLGVYATEPGLRTGGRSFLGLSGELRSYVTESIGVVAFYDSGYVGPDSWGGKGGDWQAGAGLGLRYDTGIGPIRFDVAAPVTDETEDGIQFYIGIGQAF